MKCKNLSRIRNSGDGDLQRILKLERHCSGRSLYDLRPGRLNSLQPVSRSTALPHYNLFFSQQPESLFKKKAMKSDYVTHKHTLRSPTISLQLPRAFHWTLYNPSSLSWSTEPQGEIGPHLPLQLLPAPPFPLSPDSRDMGPSLPQVHPGALIWDFCTGCSSA